MSQMIDIHAQSTRPDYRCKVLVRSTDSVPRATLGAARVQRPLSCSACGPVRRPDHAADGVGFVDVPRTSRLLGKWAMVGQKVPRLRVQSTLRPGRSLAESCRADAALSIDPVNRGPRAETRIAEHLRRLSLVSVCYGCSVAYLRTIGVVDMLLPVVDSIPVQQAQVVDTRTRRPAEVGDGVLGEVIGLVHDHLAHTGCSVLLVLHMALLNGNAFIDNELFHEQLLQALDGLTTSLAVVPGGFNAAQFKCVISRCRLLITAHTDTCLSTLERARPRGSLQAGIPGAGPGLTQ